MKDSNGQPLRFEVEQLATKCALSIFKEIQQNLNYKKIDLNEDKLDEVYKKPIRSFILPIYNKKNYLSLHPRSVCYKLVLSQQKSSY